MAHAEHIRFHVLIPADLYASLKKVAAEEGDRSVSSLIREVCEERVSRDQAAAA